MYQIIVNMDDSQLLPTSYNIAFRVSVMHRWVLSSAFNNKVFESVNI